MPSNKLSATKQEAGYAINYLAPERPSHLAYRSKDGLFTTYVPSKQAVFAEFAETILRWVEVPTDKRPQGKALYRILDTFNGNFLEHGTLRKMLDRAKREKQRVEVLLLDPMSRTGALRAKSLAGGLAVDRARLGLKAFLSAIAGKEEAESYAQKPLSELLSRLRSKAKSAGLPLAIKFYGASPSRPMLFCGDIVLAGTYRYGRDSMDLPWQVFVDDPNCEHDSYDCCCEEFEFLWTTEDMSYDEPGTTTELFTRPVIFISYSHEDQEDADHIEALLRRRDCFTVIRDEENYTSGPIDKRIRTLIDGSHLFLAISSKDWKASSYCQAELSHFLKGGAGHEDRVVAIRVDESELPSSLKNVTILQSGTTRGERENAVNNICEDVVLLPRSAKARFVPISDDSRSARTTRARKNMSRHSA